MKEFLDRNSPEEREARRQSKKCVGKGSRLKNSRYIPLETKDKVKIMGNFQCNFVSPEGVRCEASHDLEIDHIEPFSLGGSSQINNLRLTCKAHNIMYARKVLGDEVMGRYINKG